MFGWSWIEASVLGSQVIGQASMESCDVQIANKPDTTVTKRLWEEESSLKHKALKLWSKNMLSTTLDKMGQQQAKKSEKKWEQVVESGTSENRIKQMEARTNG